MNITAYRRPRVSQTAAAIKARQSIRSRTISDLFDSEMLVELIKQSAKDARRTGRPARRFTGGEGDRR